MSARAVASTESPDSTPKTHINLETTEVPPEGSVGPALAQQDIACLAYAIWQERGCQIGSAEEDWFEAERRLQASSAKTVLVGG